MPVLDAAANYDMKRVVGSLSVQLMKGIERDGLMYQNPVWVYVKAKQLELADLEKAAANATMTIDLHNAPRNAEVDNAPALWILELITVRETHRQWWRTKCNTSIRIANMDATYNPVGSYNKAFYGRTGCQCPQLGSVDTIQPPIELVLKIMAYPCAKSVREIDFNQAIGCLRCGAATTAHYKKISQAYEGKFW